MPIITRYLMKTLQKREAVEVLGVNPETLRRWDLKAILIAVRIGDRSEGDLVLALLLLYTCLCPYINISETRPRLRANLCGDV